MDSAMPIARAAQQCIEALTGCIEIRALMENEWAENRLADMNLWISGTGACASGRASLDSRLATKSEVGNVIANSLRLLVSMINQCRTQCQKQDAFHPSEDRSPPSQEDGPTRAFSPWSDDSSSDTSSDNIHEKYLSSNNQLQESMYNVESIIDQLARIAVAIRRSGRRSRFKKADQRFNETEHQELQDHLTGIMLILFKKSPPRLDCHGLNEVQLRLIRCNLKRRSRFIYAQKHSRGLDHGLTSHAGHDYAPSLADPKGETTGAKENLETPRKEAHDTNQTAITGTSASALSDTIIIPQADSGPAASSIISSTAIDLDYPRPPRFKKNAHIFRCPCCCEALPVTMADKNRWRKHVSDDLSPYTCILPSCDQPDVLYSTKEVWRQHILEHSSTTYWVCLACGDGTQFGSEEAFVAHTKSTHASSIALDQINVLTSLSKHSTPMEIRRCPLCNWPDDGEGEVQKNLLLDHIAKEIHSFSLRALPWSDDNGQEIDEHVRNSNRKVHEWLVRNHIQDDPDHEKPPHEKRKFFSQYFQQNAYFADDSGESATSELDSDVSRASELKQLREIQGSVAPGSQRSDTDNMTHASITINTKIQGTKRRLAEANDQENPGLEAGVIAGVPHFLCQSISDIHKQFQDLEWMQHMRLNDGHLSNDLSHRFALDSDPQVKEKNRYENVQAWNNCRIHLQVPEGECDYINASPITLKDSVTQQERRYIATQGPKEGQAFEFWKMVFDESREVGVIVMLTQTFEDGRAKCAQYFPLDTKPATMHLFNESDILFEDGDGLQMKSPVVRKITLLELVFDARSRSEIRKLELTIGTKSKIVWHFLFAGWADYSKPEGRERDALLELIKLSASKCSAENPRVVHCSAGVGRTGVFIALDHLLRELESGHLSSATDDPVYETVNRMREQRMMMVYNEQQMQFIYEVLREQTQLRLSRIPDHPYSDELSAREAELSDKVDSEPVSMKGD